MNTQNNVYGSRVQKGEYFFSFDDKQQIRLSFCYPNRINNTNDSIQLIPHIYWCVSKGRTKLKAGNKMTINASKQGFCFLQYKG